MININMMLLMIFPEYKKKKERINTKRNFSFQLLEFFELDNKTRKLY